MPFDSYKLKRLRDFLNSKYGIFIDDEKLFNIYKRKFLKLMEKFKYKDFDKFYNDIVLFKNRELSDEVVGTITVNETYFFREKYQFDILINHIIPQLNKIRPKTESINILSAPCSTGEEVYSIAIMLMEEKKLINERDFMLLGIDIDKNAIEKAKNGIFSQRSVHKLPEEILIKYFDKVKNGYKAKNILKNAVNFKVVNILNRYEMKKLGKFDVIFSRNMLIYFDDKNKKETLTIFYNILKEKGYLFLGHAEKVPSNLGLFKQIKIGDTYVYRKE